MAPPLVDYGSDSEGDGSECEVAERPARQQQNLPPSNLIAASKRSQSSEGPESPAKKRKLTRLDSSNLNRSHNAKDEPQPLERQQTEPVKKPQREGDWLCHAFVRVPLRSEIHGIMDEISRGLRNACSEGDDLRLAESDTQTDSLYQAGIADVRPTELHISLTRPILVRPHERSDFRHIVTEHVAASKTFEFHFARVATLINDDRSRLFFALEVGSGWNQLHDLALALNKPLEQAFRAKAYYSEARYHASFASVKLARSANLQQWEELGQNLDQSIGPSLRRCPPFSAEHIGIRIGAHITDVSLQD